jgi:hypothetical protein
VMVTKYDRPVVVVMAFEEYERLKAVHAPKHLPTKKQKAKG